MTDPRASLEELERIADLQAKAKQRPGQICDHKAVSLAAHEIDFREIADDMRNLIEEQTQLIQDVATLQAEINAQNDEPIERKWP